MWLPVSAGETASVDVVVGAHGAEDDDKEAVLGRLHGETHLVGDHVGADVQGGAGLGGDPVGVLLHDGLDGVHKQVLIQMGEAHALTGAVDAGGVHVGTEEVDLPVGGQIGLHALKHHLGVVEDGAGGIQAEGGIGDDASVVPALALVIVHEEHVVGEVLAKAQVGLVGLLLGMGGAGHRKRIGHGDCHLSFVKSKITRSSGTGPAAGRERR